jgi:hypothetical protein
MLQAFSLTIALSIEHIYMNLNINYLNTRMKKQTTKIIEDAVDTIPKVSTLKISAMAN